MSLVKKVVFVANVSKRFTFIKPGNDRIQPDNGGKFLWCRPNNFPEPLFKRALTDK